MLTLYFSFHLCKNILGILSEIDHHYLICETCTLKMQNRNRPETLYSKSMMKKPTSSFFFHTKVQGVCTLILWIVPVGFSCRN